MPTAIEALAATSAPIIEELAAIGPNSTATPVSQPDATIAAKTHAKPAAQPWKRDPKPFYGWRGDDYALNGGSL